ncbi:MAG: GAF domain-containing sensor histidine kinase [Acidimicrobiia bacterium]|nr:GAF domain-containing sensor histidine kinase [Acidimicrobiia bacterium]
MTEAAARELAWSALLREIISIAGEERDLRSLLREVARLVVGATEADACFVHVVDRDAGEVVLMGATPDEFDALAGTIRLPIGEGIAGWVAEHGRPALVGDKWADPRYRYIPALRGEAFDSLVSVPLLRPPATTVGVLNVHAHGRGRFGTDTVSRLEEVASLVAGVVEGGVLHDRLQRREAELERFAVRTIELQELDRRRIAGDIHDGISQRLVSAWYHLRAAISLTADPDVDRELAATAALLSEALEDSRRAITGLRPALLDDLGLRAAITSVAAGLGGVEADVDLADCDLAPHVETALFRIVQETLQNIEKHARASTVVVTLAEEPDAVVLTVTDDGVGFDPVTAAGPTSFGLAGIHERASLLGATLLVRSSPGAGTTVAVRLPTDRSRRE